MKSALPELDLTSADNYFDNAMWHARIIGCIAEGGIRNGFRVEFGRRFARIKNCEVNYLDFLKRYCALYDKYVGKWEHFSERSWTEIDLTFLDPRRRIVIAAFEFENSHGEVLDNIVKFKALHSFDPNNFKLELCSIGFWAPSRKRFDLTMKGAIELVSKIAKGEKATFHRKRAYRLDPLRCYWMLFGLFKDAPEPVVKCQSTILDPDTKQREESEFKVAAAAK